MLDLKVLTRMRARAMVSLEYEEDLCFQILLDMGREPQYVMTGSPPCKCVSVNGVLYRLEALPMFVQGILKSTLTTDAATIVNYFDGGDTPVHTNTYGREYVDLSDMSEHARECFRAWLFGQTVPVIDGVEEAAYLHDYLRWRQGLPAND
jgi:hypothetical protein